METDHVPIIDITETENILEKSHYKMVDLGKFIKEHSNEPYIFRPPFGKCKFVVEQKNKSLLYFDVWENKKEDGFNLYISMALENDWREWILRIFTDGKTVDIVDVLPGGVFFRNMELTLINHQTMDVRPVGYGDVFFELFRRMSSVLLNIILSNYKRVKIIYEKSAEQKRRMNSLNRKEKKTIYNILVIEWSDDEWIYHYPLSSIFKNNNGKTSCPFHSVRQHRRYYSPARPLFGKYSGWVLVPFHHRGSKENGEIITDYIIRRKRVRRQKEKHSN